MPENSEFKQIVRARMRITGEKYTVALRAVIDAARAAIPRWQDDPLDRLPSAAGSDLAELILACLPGLANRADGGAVIAMLADLCHYLAGCRTERAEQRPLESWNLAAAERLAACAADLAAIPASDPRLLAIAETWADEDAAAFMHQLDATVISSIGFNLSGGELIDILARQATRILLDNPYGD